MSDKNTLHSPVGFFDSGVGGLSVYSRFKKRFPGENTIYFGDTKNLPYGNKTKEELISYARHILDFFKSKQVKAVVIACNTSSALVYDTIKNEYNFQIFPIIQSCAKIIAQMDIANLMVFATEGTVSSLAYTREITKYKPTIKVKEIACPKWVNIVEYGNINSEDALNNIKLYMNKIAEYKPDKVILGCTHYPYLMQLFEQYYTKDLFIDPAEIFVEYIGHALSIYLTDYKGAEEFYVSADPLNFVKKAKLFYDIKHLPNLY